MDRETKIATTGIAAGLNPGNPIRHAAEEAFNRQAPVFDLLYGEDTIIRYKRERVRAHVNQFLPPHASILELNAGTGEDAVYFANRGHFVHATDISEGMLEKLEDKVRMHQLSSQVSREKCSYTELELLQQQGPYDYIFSNFAGLNCTSDLGKVLDSFSWLLKPGGHATLVILPRFCLWEFLLLFRGKWRTALRRFSGHRGARAHIEGEYFRCWYYNPSFVTKHLKGNFKLVALEGLCTLVPPSYIRHFPEKHPGIYRILKNLENKWKATWPWRNIGDYYVVTLQKHDEGDKL